MSESCAPPDAAVKLAEGFEGFRARPYRDSAGVWTIGYGSTRDARGRPVTATTPPVTEAEAEALMRRDLQDAFDEVIRDADVGLTADQASALTDFVYNLGAGAFRSSTL